MSLIICYTGDDYQLWLSDGLTVAPKGSDFECIRENTEKISILSRMNVLCGWVGEKFDAEWIMEEIRFLPRMKHGKLLEVISKNCRRINRLSRIYCLEKNEFFCPTGLLIGGYDCEDKFLATVTPQGQIKHFESLGAIGIGSHQVTKSFSEFSHLSISLVDAFDKIVGIAKMIFSENELIGGDLHCWVISKFHHLRLPSWRMDGPPQICAHRRETLYRFAQKCFYTPK